MMQTSQIMERGKLHKAEKIIFPHQGLQAPASMTPPEFQVETIYKFFEAFPFNGQPNSSASIPWLPSPPPARTK